MSGETKRLPIWALDIKGLALRAEEERERARHYAELGDMKTSDVHVRLASRYEKRIEQLKGGIRNGKNQPA